MVRLEKSRGSMHHMDGRPTAQKKSIMKQKLGAVLPSPPLPPAVAVDYPQSGERVVSREYAFRISSEAQGDVEASIDGEAWLPCRQAAGYWWHDWSGYRAGPHSVVARVSHRKGHRSLSDRRDFIVEFA